MHVVQSGRVSCVGPTRQAVAASDVAAAAAAALFRAGDVRQASRAGRGACPQTLTRAGMSGPTVRADRPPAPAGGGAASAEARASDRRSAGPHPLSLPPRAAAAGTGGLMGAMPGQCKGGSMLCDQARISQRKRTESSVVRRAGTEQTSELSVERARGGRKSDRLLCLFSIRSPFTNTHAPHRLHSPLFLPSVRHNPPPHPSLLALKSCTGCPTRAAPQTSRRSASPWHRRRT
jgi:hypothetical protein